jgi:hypothetical protein
VQVSMGFEGLLDVSVVGFWTRIDALGVILNMDLCIVCGVLVMDCWM